MKDINNQEVESEVMEEIDQQSNEATDNMSQDEAGESVNEAAEWQDKYIRLSAEFDNYRKRTLKEKMELIQNGGADVLKVILSTADDFERALSVMQEGHDREGMRLIYVNFMDSLKSKGVVEIEALGKPFDVDYHEAIARVPATAEFATGVVVDVIQKGYMLKDRVLRFPKVVVAE